jgi:hypothetical protein
MKRLNSPLNATSASHQNKLSDGCCCCCLSSPPASSAAAAAAAASSAAAAAVGGATYLLCTAFSRCSSACSQGLLTGMCSSQVRVRVHTTNTHSSVPAKPQQQQQQTPSTVDTKCDDAAGNAAKRVHTTNTHSSVPARKQQQAAHVCEHHHCLLWQGRKPCCTCGIGNTAHIVYGIVTCELCGAERGVSACVCGGLMDVTCTVSMTSKSQHGTC